MKRRRFIKQCVAGSAALGFGVDAMSQPKKASRGTRIFFSAPQIADPYYKVFFGELLQFYGRMVKATAPGDEAFIVADKATMPKHREVSAQQEHHEFRATTNYSVKTRVCHKLS
ncbi:MAG: hypothetical protein CMJ78_23860 [Planctomycetaceae bacterium]|nr:hypothetical protein [Planctomycetaceae bacterium]